MAKGQKVLVAASSQNMEPRRFRLSSAGMAPAQSNDYGAFALLLFACLRKDLAVSVFHFGAKSGFKLHVRYIITYL